MKLIVVQNGKKGDKGETYEKKEYIVDGCLFSDHF